MLRAFFWYFSHFLHTSRSPTPLSANRSLILNFRARARLTEWFPPAPLCFFHDSLTYTPLIHDSKTFLAVHLYSIHCYVMDALCFRLSCFPFYRQVACSQRHQELVVTFFWCVIGDTWRSHDHHLNFSVGFSGWDPVICTLYTCSRDENHFKYHWYID